MRGRPEWLSRYRGASPSPWEIVNESARLRGRMARKNRPRECRECGANAESGVTISWAGLCPEHQYTRMRDNLVQIHEHRGPFFDHWRRQTIAAFGGVLLDDPRAKG